MSSRRFKGKRPGQKSARASFPWPSVLIAAGLVLLGVAAYAVFGNGAGGSAPVEVQGSPRLRVDRESLDLGEIKLGQTVEARFRLTNVGDQPLRIAETPYVEVVEGC